MDWNIINDIWRPLLEIGILSVGYYYIFVLVKGTRGAAIMTGFMVVLLSLALLTTLLELEVLGWLLKAFFAFIAIAAVVLFQPELRHILAELGNKPWFASAREQRENIEVVIQAISRMAEMRIGALIAIERFIQLSNIVESGLAVDCEATPEMLETIFFPNNAIHDGGVIIRGDRIAYAACIFPLTQRQGLGKSVGTRHRAALGLSEETDAVVIVVSEETSTISYAFKGQLVRGVSEEMLRSFLTGIFVKKNQPRKISELVRNWWNIIIKKVTS